MEKAKSCEEYQKVVRSYCQCLQKMESIVAKGCHEVARKIVEGYNIEIEELVGRNHIMQSEIDRNFS